jgi:hypothetical protein
MPVIYAIMLGIHRHYARVREELRWQDDQVVLPARNHAVVLVSQLHLPTARALAYARAWSAGGGSSSCTTRARCGSRAGCCSSPA